MEAGNEGWRIVPELAPAADEAVVHKTSRTASWTPISTRL